MIFPWFFAGFRQAKSKFLNHLESMISKKSFWTFQPWFVLKECDQFNSNFKKKLNLRAMKAILLFFLRGKKKGGWWLSTPKPNQWTDRENFGQVHRVALWPMGSPKPVKLTASSPLKNEVWPNLPIPNTHLSTTKKNKWIVSRSILDTYL